MYDSSYFNTVSNQKPDEVMSYANYNDDQNSVILAIFKTNQDKHFTPYDIEIELRNQNKKYLITSIRRAITTLTEEKQLVKTAETVMCKYNRASHLWTLNPILKTQQIKLIY
jgi:hypothetical protein